MTSLHNKSKLMSAMWETLPLPAYVFDANGILLTFNKCAATTHSIQSVDDVDNPNFINFATIGQDVIAQLLETAQLVAEKIILCDNSDISLENINESKAYKLTKSTSSSSVSKRLMSSLKALVLGCPSFKLS